MLIDKEAPPSKDNKFHSVVRPPTCCDWSVAWSVDTFRLSLAVFKSFT